MHRRMLTTGTIAVVLLATSGCAVISRSSQPRAPVEAALSVDLDHALSRDGRFVAFTSPASNLVPSDTNNESDVFVHDRIDRTTVRVSITTGGVQANGDSWVPAVSGDGRYVAFASSATQTVAGDTNNADDVFVRDRQLGTTALSVDTFGVEGDDDSSLPALSDDGRYVAFGSSATNLVAADSNNAYDIFVRDRQTGTTARVSVTTSGGQARGNAADAPALSGDGRYVAFGSDATNMLGPGGDTNNARDIFVRDRIGATTTRVSVGPGAVQANGDSLRASISDNGRYVVFQSTASNLVIADANAAFDVFVHDRQTGATDRASITSVEAEIALGGRDPAHSDSGRFVVFTSDASTIVAGDTNSVRDVFLRDRTAGTTTRVSVQSNGQQAGGGSSDRTHISGDGEVITFVLGMTNLVPDDTNAAADIFARLPTAATTARVSVAGAEANAASSEPAVSGDGRYVAFSSSATNLVPCDTNATGDVFVRDHSTGAVARVSVNTGGVQANGGSSSPAISTDSRYIVFTSAATNLAAGDTNNAADIFWHDRLTGITERVSLGDTENQGGAPSLSPDVSNDGRYIVFTTTAALNAGDSNGTADIYRRDRVSSSTLNISRDPSNAPSNGTSVEPVLSANGLSVVFASNASDLVANDTNGAYDVFRRDVVNATTTRASVATFLTEGNGPSRDPSVSDDGLTIAFESDATNLVGGDTNASTDAFVRRLTCSPSPCFPSTTRVSVATGGAQGAGASSNPRLDSDAEHVAFESSAANLVPGDTNGLGDTFVRDRVTQRTGRASTQLFLAQSTTGSASEPAISGDGRVVAFMSLASDLVAGDMNQSRDVFLRAQPTPTVTNVTPNSHADGGAAFPMTITGTNFLQGAQVRLTRQTITGVVNMVTDTTITATVNIPLGTPAGAVDVYVANPGSGPGFFFGTLGRCDNCLTVT